MARLTYLYSAGGGSCVLGGTGRDPELLSVALLEDKQAGLRELEAERDDLELSGFGLVPLVHEDMNPGQSPIVPEG